MTTYAVDDLKRILELHRKWLYGEEGGKRANLSGSDLRGSDLSGSDLRGSNLSGSNLSGSDLSGSDLSGSDLSGSDLSGSNLSGSDLRDSDLRGSNLSGAILSDGVSWADYLNDVVPALLTAGGKPLEEVATEEVWNCHSWDNCPMHAAFGAENLSEVPALHRWQAERFIQLFDAKVIPLPTIPPKTDEPVAA